MPFTLDDVVPWGRSFAEYRQMFDLDEPDLQRRILGCANGPSSFNAALTRRGGRLVSLDPIYEFGAEELHEQIETTHDRIMQKTHEKVSYHFRKSANELLTLRTPSGVA